MQTKLGLALSGGGFRASFFHIGVLARLADLGLLRSVEVISTVSGGSIVGALFYLYVRRLLHAKSDEQITDADYQEVVAEMLGHFKRVVQMNLRMRTFDSVLRNWKMIWPNYSRADSIGELFDQHFYRPVFDPKLGRMVEMREIKVTPKKDGMPQQGFKPKIDNAGRRAKVPIVLINATDLNTGHNWRFEASRMGEPHRDVGVELEVDGNMRLERPDSYEDVVAEHQNVEVGLAVGASAAVPGLFPPLALSNLYPGARIQLADGGVHDNQGVQGLIDPDTACTHFVVSDASGPLQDVPEPETGSLAVVQRSSDVQFDRIREEQVTSLLERHGDRAAYMHLRKGLAVPVLPYRRAEARHAPEPSGAPDATEAFGIAPTVQDVLSRVRTDLDSFSDIEAHSLMLDGYNMSEASLRKLLATLGTGATRGLAARDWVFLRIAPWAQGKTPQPQHEKYLKHLKVARQRLFKPFRLSAPLLVVGLALLALALAGLYYWLQDEIRSLLNRPLWTLLSVLAVIALGWIAPMMRKAFEALRWLRDPLAYAAGFGAWVLLGILGAFAIRLYLATLDRLFLWMGRIERLE